MKLTADIVDVARRGADRWYVTNGATAVGPVNLELLARGVEAGKVPISSFVRNEAWKVWRPLREITEITTEDGVQVRELSRSSYEPAQASLELGLTPGELGCSASDDINTNDTLDESDDQREALLLLLAATVARGHAEVAIIHEVADDGAVAVCAHGPDVFEALGLRTRLLDPALIAAAAGSVVISEPSPGPAGLAILGRLSRLGVPVESAVMLPIRPHGRLFGTIELGCRSAFRPGDLAAFETLVDALVLKLEALEAHPSSN